MIQLFQIYPQLIPPDIARVLKDDGAGDGELDLGAEQSDDTFSDLVVVRDDTSVTGGAAGYRGVTSTKPPCLYTVERSINPHTRIHIL